MNFFLGKKTQVQILVPLKNFLDLFLFKIFFFNRRYWLLSFSGPQLYNLDVLPFTYGQYYKSRALPLNHGGTHLFC